MAQYVRINGNDISDPFPLPQDAMTPDGYRTDIPGQLREGHITPTRLRSWGFWPADEEFPANYNPATHRAVVESKTRRTTDVLVKYRAEPIPPPPPPETVTNFQAKAVLRRMTIAPGKTLLNKVDQDLRAQVQAAKALPEDHPDRIAAEDALAAWEGGSFVRHSPLVRQLAASYKLTDAQVDELFRQAGAVSV